jgi:RNA polymerase subunit RPABC4/transcription elongation factor Spt4
MRNDVIKLCPNCSKVIEKHRIVCQYCKEAQDPVPKKKK